jgi:hypothetical protein
VIPGTPEEHWFDRLGVAYTRRQGMKAALAAAALALPFRPGRAEASHPTSDKCQKGCLYTVDRHYEQRLQTCNDQLAFGSALGMVETLYGRLLAATYQTGFTFINAVHCRNQTLLRKKSESYDCLKPGCPGFNPDAPGGPCEPCEALRKSGGDCKCCPDPASPTGYTFFASDQPCP